ncbi:hypothetical protein [Clostridium felsineum]|uniref:Uncharacterized protein n=1 Tax=Clostridium felsineum TaxID=36839 RepID=A0A1S8L4R3_9CLOT|nr:hypothetical protein [Clostridium felsineum]MCR3761443.1 hypothetical protein [Clostridium felsineum]URZ00635.1 hypothetical protein CLAUR_006230 [Clostridium felsineum]URZ06724.1 hypothetical protein CLROS_020570 [Clostridium felsineum]URZ11757.1 hypothetical protein CROST_024740 [Clostridium felsineum]
MQHLLNMKKEGGVQIVIATLIGILIMSSVFLYFVSNIIPINATYKAETIARKYMLKIEEDGYLKEENSEKMINEFASIGISNIDISGTTLSPVTYGESVYLKVKYKETIKNLNIVNSIIPTFSNEEKNVVIEKSSTSKNVIEP